MYSSKCTTHSLPTSFDGVFFVTLRMRDALPKSFGLNLALQYYSIQVKFAQQPDQTAQLRQARKRLFARFDNALDLEKYGHDHLREPALAKIVADEILSRDGLDYTLLSYSILPNHVHLLFDLHRTLSEAPTLDDLESYRYQPLRDIVWKIQNATEAPLKKALQQLGEHIDPNTFQKHSHNGTVKMEGKFWHEQTFDFRVHDNAEFEKIAEYILHSPLKSELAVYCLE
ncbi:MAG: hypothetical protein Q7T20_14145 [Saprospiraceae bacterium]|nr:hypothetical protein [Saprospiraceae bacterium]